MRAFLDIAFCSLVRISDVLDVRTICKFAAVRTLNLTEIRNVQALHYVFVRNVL
jgi:hypothetical protein